MDFKPKPIGEPLCIVMLPRIADTVSIVRDVSSCHTKYVNRRLWASNPCSLVNKRKEPGPRRARYPVGTVRTWLRTGLQDWSRHRTSPTESHSCSKGRWRSRRDGVDPVGLGELDGRIRFQPTGGVGNSDPRREPERLQIASPVPLAEPPGPPSPAARRAPACGPPSGIDILKALTARSLREFKPALIAETEDLREHFEERAGILEYDAGLPRPEAELEAARITATLGPSWIL